MRNIDSATTQRMKKKGEGIKLPILAPLFAAILLLLLIFTLAVYNLQQQQITNEVRMRLANTHGLFNEQLATDARLLDAITNFLKNDSTIQNAWLAKDRDALLKYTTPLFENFHRDYGITHFYLIDTNSTCFLRVHNPPQFGDHIDRFTLQAAASSQKPSWGIELGKFGNFTLRSVHPWFVNNTLIGFIELGEEIEHITPQLKKGLDVDLILLIKKSFLSRDDWEQGLKAMGRSGNWDLMPDRVIADSTISAIPPEFIKFAGLSHEQHEDHLVSATFNGSTYRAGCVQLIDAAGRSVGDILVIKNISKNVASLRTLLAGITAICFLIGTLLVVLFYAHISRIEKRLLEARASLETEIEKRKTADAELRKHRDTLEETVKTRTAELEKTNKLIQAEIIERRKTEHALRKSEQRFEQVSESAGEWIWEVDTEGLYTYASPVSEKLLGYKPEEIVGKKYFYDFFPQDQKEEFKKAAFDVFNRKESFKGFVNSVIHKNGDAVILETTATPILDDKGNLIGYRGADRDITERKRAESRLLAVSELQKLLLPPVPIEQKLKLVTDALVRILDADFARIWTIKPGDLCDAGCVHAEAKDGPHICRYKDKCLHLMASSGRYTHLDGKDHRRVPFGCYKIGMIAAGEKDKFLTNNAATDPQVHNHAWVKELGLASFAGYRLTHTDGTPLGVMALFSKHPILTEENALLEGIAHSTSMVIRTSQVEEEIQKNEEFTRRVIESSSDCIKVLDLEGRLLSMSGGGQKILEIDDIVPYLNASFIDYWNGKEREGCIEAIEKAKRGETGIFYGFFATAKGTPKSWEVIITPIKDAEGNIDRLLAVSRDITARKKAEESIKNLNRDLKSTVTQLSQSNEQLRNFAHITAHDLKTPLRGIGMLAQWLSEDYREKLDDNGRQQIDLLVSRVERMDNLIDAVLQYSTLARNRQNERNVDLNLLLETTIANIKMPHNIEVSVSKKLPVVVYNEKHISQVFHNILANAVKFMDKPQGRITINCVEEEHFWQFSISDNGPGIEPRHFERIFRLFQTLSDHNHFEAIGVGLTLVKKIVELYGGRIWLTSKVGEGATFFFTLPKQPAAVLKTPQMTIS